MQDAVTETLRGMRFGLVGFGPDEVSRLRSALDLAGGRASAIDGESVNPRLNSLSMFDACVINVSAKETNDQGPAPRDLIAQKERPAILIGDVGEMRRHALIVASPIQEFMFRPWTDVELVLRAFKVLRNVEARHQSRVTNEIRKAPVVVLADDDKTTELLVSSMLKANGMLCEMAADGKEAFDLVRKLKPDMLLLDVSMPTMNGFEILGALKHDPSTMTVPVVMLTASGAEDDIVRGFSLGAEDYITKPFHPHELVARIRRLLRRREAA